MGCTPSFNRRVVSLQYPTEKERFTTLGFISSTHASAHERTFQTEHQGSGDIGTLLISLAIPVGQSSKKDLRDKRDKDEPGFRRMMTLQEGSKEFSFKGVTESCTSVDPKDMTFFRQSNGMSSSTNSYRNSMVRVESRKNSNFLLARKGSEKQLRRLDTCGDNLQKTQLQTEHLKIDNFTRSADELMYAFGSGSRNTLREDNGSYVSLTGSKVLLVVPEEGRHYENLRNDKMAQSCHTSPKQYNNKNARHVRRISDSKDKPPTPKHWPTLDFRFVRKESFNNQNESAYFGSSPVHPEESPGSKEFTSPKIAINGEEKKLIELSQPSQEQQQLPEIMTTSLSQKRQAKLTLPFISNKSASLPITTSATQEVLKNKPPTEVINLISASKPSIDEENNTRKIYKTQRSNGSNGRFKSESGVSNTIKPFNVEESPLNNLKSKFTANLLDLIAPKRNSASHSVDTQKNKSDRADGFDDCLDDISNISMRSMQKSPPISNIRERDAGDIYFKFDSFDTDTAMISPICSPIKLKRDFSKTEVKIALQKLSQTASPVESRIKSPPKSPPKSPVKSPVKSPETSSPAESRVGSRSPSVNEKSLKRQASRAEDEDEDMSFDEDDDNASNFDFDNYTFIEEAGGIEIDETKGINIYDKKTSKLEAHLARLAQLKPHQSIKRSQFGARSSILAKSKSVTYDVNTLLSVSPQKREEESEDPPNIPSLNPSEIEDGNTEGDEKSQSPNTTQLRRRQYLPSRRHSKSQVIEIGRLDTFLVEEEKIKKINQYEVGDEIGKGPIAEVYFGVDSETFKHYGIKIINKDKIDRNLGKGSEDFEQMQTEVALLKKLSHPNIGKLYEVIDDPIQDKLFFISEFINKEKTATQKAQLSEEKIRKYFRELLLGIDYLHNSANIVHRNLKPTNILISPDDTLKILDCQVSSLAVDADTSFDGSDCKESYLPPEAFENEGSKEETADIWGIGCMLYYFVYGAAPFSAGNMHGLERKIREEEPEMPEELTINTRITRLIEECLAKDPSDRPTLKEIMQNSWVTKNGQEPLFNKMSYDITVTSEEVDLAVSMFTRRSSMSPNRFSSMSPSRFSNKAMNKGLEIIEVIAESKEDLNMPESSLVIDDNKSESSP